MRGRPDDPDLWEDLYERFRRPTDPPRRRLSSALSPDARLRLLDAAVGLLGSIRTVVDVVEEVLDDRRNRLRDGTIEPRGPWLREPERPEERSAAGPPNVVVRDIPVEPT